MRKKKNTSAAEEEEEEEHTHLYYPYQLSPEFFSNVSTLISFLFLQCYFQRAKK